MQLPTIIFFSSRRRHTRFDCDWSSDVCSSDLSTKTSWWPQRDSDALGAWISPVVFLHRRIEARRDQQDRLPGASKEHLKNVPLRSPHCGVSGPGHLSLIEIGRAHV